MPYTKEKVADAAASARPYVERALRDQELRENIRNAYTSARAVYDELSSRRRLSDAATRLASDEDVQSELRNAIEELRNAANRVQGVKRGAAEPARAARNGTILLLGICLGILLNPITGPAVRRALARKLFGTGNGFVYQGNGSAAKAE
jgi:CHASE3 domain sensor protein